MRTEDKHIAELEAWADHWEANLLRVQSRLDAAEACIKAAVMVNETLHGVHLGRPRRSGIFGEHAPCMFCILQGFRVYEFDADDYRALIEEFDRHHQAQADEARMSQL